MPTATRRPQARAVTVAETGPTLTISNTGGNTNQVSQAISGTAGPGVVGATVKIFDNGGTTPLTTTLVQSDGTWSTTVNLVSGTNSLTAQVTDAAGNIGTSNTVSYVLPSFTVKWIGSNNGSWSAAANWSPANVPGPTDDVLIGVAENVNFNITGSSTIDALYSAAGSTISISGGTLTVSSASSVSDVEGSLALSGAGTFTPNVQMTLAGLTQSGGLLTGTGTVTVTGSAQLSGGRESGTGTTTVQNGATFTTTSFQLDGGHTLKLGGSSAASGANVSINLNGTAGDLGSGILTILAGATFDDQTTAASGNGLNISSSNFSGDNGSDATVNNFGTFKKSGTTTTGGPTTSIISTTFNSGSAATGAATVNVQNGTLILSGGGTDTQTSYIGAGTIQFGSGGAGGNRTIDGSSNISTANATFSGGTTTLLTGSNYNVTGTTTINGGSAVLQGTITNLGSLLTISSGSLNLNGSSPSLSIGSLTQSGGLLTTGTVTVSGSAQLSGGRESGTGTTTVQNGATFTTTSFQLDGGHTLKLGGSSAASGANVSINLNGTAGDLGSGILTILAGATFDDQTTAASGNGLNISSSNFSGDNGSDAIVNNFGTFKKSGTTTTGGPTTSIISTTFNSGSAATGAATVNVQNGTLILSGGGTDTQTSYIGAGTIQFGSGGAGGNRTIDGSSNISTANATFSGGTTTLLTGSNYNVTGTTTINGGSAVLQGTITNLGSLLTISSGSLNLNGSSPSLSIGSLTQSGGLLTTGTVTVSGSAQLSGGRESGTGTTTVQNGATFTTTSFQLDGGHTLKLGGSSAASGANVSINLNGTAGDLGSGILTILAGATFDDQTTAASGNGLNISSSNFSGDNGSDAIVNNFGTFKKSGTTTTGGPTTSIISTTFNSGSAATGAATVNVQNGTLILSGGGTDTQTSYIGAGTIQFGSGGAGGNRTIDGSSNISTANATFSGGTTTLLTGSNYNVTGTTTINGGSAVLQGTITNLGSLLTISSGSLNLNGSSPSLSIGSLTQSGGLLTTGTVTVSGSAQLSGGRESGTGTTTVQNGATFTTTSFQLDGGHTLKLGGSSAASGANVSINLNGTAGDLGSGILTILAGATFDDQTTAASGNGLNISSSNFSGDNGSDATVNNFGTFKKSGTATTSTISTRFNNTGTVNIQAGTLALSGGGSISGTFNLALGTFVQFNSNFALNGNAAFLGGALSGTGALTIGSHADVEFSSATATAGPTIAFSDGTGELILAAPSTFQSAISGLAVGDAIDLMNVQVASATINGSKLNITETNNQTLSYQISGALAGNSFSVQSSPTDSKLVLVPDSGISGTIAAGYLSFAPASAASYQYTGVNITGPGGNGIFVQSVDTNPADSITVSFDATSSISVTGVAFDGIDIITAGASISISDAAPISASRYGILASNSGAGNITITSSGQINSGSAGINAKNEATSLPQTGGVTTSLISVTANGTINSGPIRNASGTQPAGILAGFKGGTTDTVNANVFGNVAINNYANITAGGGDGIRGYNYGIGNITITDETNTTIVAPGEFGIRTANYGSGNVLVTTSSGDAINSGSAGISAINFATAISSSAGTTINVVANGTINSGLVLTPSGSQPQAISAGYFGANGVANTNINGSVSVDNFANVTAAAGYGINAFNYGNGSILVKDESGTSVSGAEYGIYASSISTLSGTVTVQALSGATISAGALYGLYGIAATTTNPSNISVTTATGDIINSGGIGIFAVSGTIGATSASQISVTANGNITSGFDMNTNGGSPGGIWAGYNGGSGAVNTAVAGNVVVDSFATINSPEGSGILLFNYGTGSLALTLETSSSVTAAQWGVNAFARGGGNVTINNSGTVTSASGIGITTGTGNGVANSVSGVISITNSGTITGQGGFFTPAISIANDSSQAATFTNTSTGAVIANQSATNNVNFAIESSPGPITINNSGSITGNVQLTTATFNNNGVWNVRGYSNFANTSAINNLTNGTIVFSGVGGLTSSGTGGLAITNSNTISVNRGRGRLYWGSRLWYRRVLARRAVRA